MPRGPTLKLVGFDRLAEGNEFIFVGRVLDAAHELVGTAHEEGVESIRFGKQRGCKRSRFNPAARAPSKSKSKKRLDA